MDMSTIDFTAARRRILDKAASHTTYVDVSFDPAELEPIVARPLLADMFLDVVRDCGGDVKAIASDLKLGK
jgi:hypothetical protein